jgi:predicted Zn-dependent peptidase
MRIKVKMTRINICLTTPEAEYKAIDAVTKEQIYDLAAKLFVPEKARLAIIGPFETDEPFVKILSTQK